MSSLLDTAIKRSQLVRDWRTWVLRIAAAAREVVCDAKVYVVGSVIRGDSVGGSDVDVLVVSERVPERPAERAKLKALIEERLGLPYYHPFEVHILRPEEAGYYVERSGGRILEVTGSPPADAARTERRGRTPSGGGGS